MVEPSGETTADRPERTLPGIWSWNSRTGGWGVWNQMKETNQKIPIPLPKDNSNMPQSLWIGVRPVADRETAEGKGGGAIAGVGLWGLLTSPEIFFRFGRRFLARLVIQT